MLFPFAVSLFFLIHFLAWVTPLFVLCLISFISPTMDLLFSVLDDTLDELVWGGLEKAIEPELEVLIDSAELRGIFDPLNDTQLPFVEIYEDARHIGNTEGYCPEFSDTASALQVSIKPVWNQRFRFRANGTRHYRFVVCIDHHVRARTVCGECGFAAADVWAAAGKLESPLAVSMMIVKRNEVTGILRITCSIRLPGDDMSMSAEKYEWKRPDLLSLGKRSAVFECRPQHLPPTKSKLVESPPFEYSKEMLLGQSSPPKQTFVLREDSGSKIGRPPSQFVSSMCSSSHLRNYSPPRVNNPERAAVPPPKHIWPPEPDINPYKGSIASMPTPFVPTPPASQVMSVKTPAACALTPSLPCVPSSVDDFQEWPTQQRAFSASEPTAQHARSATDIAVPNEPLPVDRAASVTTSRQRSKSPLSREGSQVSLRSEGRIFKAADRAADLVDARQSVPAVFDVEPIAIEQVTRPAQQASQPSFAPAFGPAQAQGRSANPLLWSSAPCVVASTPQHREEYAAAAVAPPSLSRQPSEADMGAPRSRHVVPEAPVVRQASPAEASDSADVDQYMADNSLLKADTLGLGYRASRNREDTLPDQSCVYWSMPVYGIDEGNGWLRVPQTDEAGEAAPDLFLPMELSGLPVLRPPRREETASWPRASHDARRLASGRSHQSYVLPTPPLQAPQLNPPSRSETPRGL